MADVVSPEVRSRMMAGIRGKDTKPEMIIRRGLHAKGFRYILHDKRLPGKPDLVLPKYRAAIFVHGCFWHGHDCHLFKWPKTRTAFWRKKIERNREIDIKAISELRANHWRCATVWECAIDRRNQIKQNQAVIKCSQWLLSDKRLVQFRSEVQK